MKGTTGLLIGVGAYLAYNVWAQAQAVKQLRVSLGTIAYNKTQSSLLKSQLIVKLIIRNPTRETLSFDQFAGVVSVAGQQLAEFNYSQPGKITPGDTPLQIPVDLQHLTLGSTLVSFFKNLLAGKKVLQTFTIDGNLYVQGIMIPINGGTATLTSISGIAGRTVAKGLIPSYNVTDASGRRFNSNDPYTLGCPDCITPNPVV